MVGDSPFLLRHGGEADGWQCREYTSRADAVRAAAKCTERYARKRVQHDVRFEVREHQRAAGHVYTTTLSLAE